MQIFNHLATQCKPAQDDCQPSVYAWNFWLFAACVNLCANQLAHPFGHPSQVSMQVLVLQTCVDLRDHLDKALEIIIIKKNVEPRRLFFFKCKFIFFCFLMFLDVFVKWWGLNFGENSQALHNKYWLTHLQSEFIAVYLSFLCLSWYVLTHHISLDNVTNMWKLKEARKMLEIWVALAEPSTFQVLVLPFRDASDTVVFPLQNTCDTANWKHYKNVGI